MTRPDPFESFWRAFPRRPDAPGRDMVLAAWEHALRAGADPEWLVDAAGRYAAAVAGREPRYICAATRWLAERRWQSFQRPAPAPAAAPQAPAASMVWIEYGSKEWEAWAAFRRATRGKGPPLDRRGGWRFPTRFPPAIEAAE